MDYLILDYSDGTKEGKNEPELTLVNEQKVWRIIQDAHKDEKTKISIYKIGECVIDFS